MRGAYRQGVPEVDPKTWVSVQDVDASMVLWERGVAWMGSCGMTEEGVLHVNYALCAYRLPAQVYFETVARADSPTVPVYSRQRYRRRCVLAMGRVRDATGWAQDSRTGPRREGRGEESYERV